MLNIVMPMAGWGSRFADAGYEKPKPLLPVHGRPMIDVVVDNLRPSERHRFIFICRSEHCAEHNLETHLRSLADNVEVVAIDSVTRGAAETVLNAASHIDSDEPLMIANSDQFVGVSIDAYLAMMSRRGCDYFLMTMTADDPKWSYLRFDTEGSVVEVVEKRVVSTEATVGIYNYRHGDSFVSAAQKMIDEDALVNGEFYVAPVYNYLIGNGAELGYWNIGSEGDGMWGLGIPRDLEAFNNLAALPVRGVADEPDRRDTPSRGDAS